MIRRNLLDLNVLIALADQRHDQHQMARAWFATHGKHNWGICPFTETGFLRVTTNPAFRPSPQTIESAIAVLQSVKGMSGYWYWEIKESWAALTAPFAPRVTGHQQVTDAYLLGMAIKEGGVLVTFDRGLKYLAGSQFSKNLLVLE
jgi:hypothetical protein